MKPHPYQNLHWYLLISSKNIWPNISVAYFTKWFQSIFTVGGWRMYPFNLPLLAPAYISTQCCKRASFWSLNPTQARHLFLKSDVGPKAKFSEGVKICTISESQKNAVFGYSYRYTVYHTQNNNHLDQNIGIIWHKHSILVKDNTAEYKVSQEKTKKQKKLSRIYPWWRC